jgi:hypothetical protein
VDIQKGENEIQKDSFGIDAFIAATAIGINRRLAGRAGSESLWTVQGGLFQKGHKKRRKSFIHFARLQNGNGERDAT